MINGTYTTSALHPKAVLSWADIEKAIDLLTPILYYQTTKFIDRGSVFLMKETHPSYLLGSTSLFESPEYILVHTEDLDIVKKRVYNRRLVDIKEWRKE